MISKVGVGRGSILLLVAILSLCLVGESYAGPTGKIAGNVTNASDGTPVEAATVEAVQGGTTVQQTSTEADGQYLLNKMPLGAYDVVVSKAEFITETVTGVSVEKNKTTAVDVALTPDISSVGQIIGTVSDASTSVGIGGATVAAKQTGTTKGSATTTVDGTYTIPNLPEGTYDVEASAPQYLTETKSGQVVTAGETTLVDFFLSPAPQDTEPPSMPGNLTATPENSTSISLTWSPSTDNVGVAGYKVMREGAQVATTVDTNYIDQGLAPGTTYCYTVSAFDGAGNESDGSDSSCATTLPGPPPQLTEIVSVDSSGGQGNQGSSGASISADGRFVAFESYASNLVAGDTNGKVDVFVHDRSTGQTRRVSVDSSGKQATKGDSSLAAISANGRYVAFVSTASNLVRGDRNKASDIFVHDLQTGVTEIVSINSSGEQGNGESSFRPAISADGRYVAFVSWATNLVASDTNGSWDVFVRDRQTGTTEVVSVSSSGVLGGSSSSSPPAISGDGRYVAFASYGSNLVPGDTNGCTDIFVHDRVTHATERVSVDSAGVQANSNSDAPAISADGQFVAFESEASNLSLAWNGTWNVFMRDRVNGITEMVSLSHADQFGNNWSAVTDISSDGRFVVFESAATNLVADDMNNKYDIFVRDREAGTTEMVSVGNNGMQGNQNSYQPAISANGRFVGFNTYSDNLVENDTNGYGDVFVRDYWGGSSPPEPPDEDGDGVTDYLDLCPGTPAGEPVDATGCGASQLDDDNDGVTNDIDLCPGTPDGEPVDTNGCAQSQRDDDSDGVANGFDLCPSTPAGDPVDANGCSYSQLDDDADGVPNGWDQCPGTSSGEAVDAYGCAESELDDDNDGVTNDSDQCPETQEGQPVDGNGCSTFDDDNDGVTNDFDLCPSTPAGDPVDANGCSAIQQDNDGDGVMNYIEEKLGTNSDDPNSIPKSILGYEYDARGEVSNVNSTAGSSQ